MLTCKGAKKHPTAVVLVLLFLGAIQKSRALEKTWSLYHSLNGGQDFSVRATVVLSVETESKGVEISVKNDNSTLNDETFLAAKQPGAMYQLKLVEGDDLSSNFLLTSVPACQILRANFREEMVLTLGPHASAISLSYIPLVSPLAPKSCDHEYWEERRLKLPEGWETRISWETATPGMVLRPVVPNYKPPPGLKWLPRVGPNGKTQGPPGTGQGEGGEQGTGQEMPTTPMGFIRRYWYILLPLFIANFMGASEAPASERQSGDSSAGGASGQAQEGAAPTAAPSGGGNAPKSRRGKRG